MNLCLIILKYLLQIRKSNQFQVVFISFTIDNLQVTYTDLDLCHRFAKFVVNEKNIGKVKMQIQSFIEELKEIESGIVYQKLQTDQDIINSATHKIESQGKTKLGQNYTLYIVVDPKKNIPPIFPIESSLIKDEEENKLLGSVENVKGNIIKMEKGKSGKLSTWVKHFHRMLTPICNDQPIYFELRPIAFKE